VPRYLVESYAVEAAVEEACQRARLAAQEDAGVRYVRTTFLPEEETVFHVFEAPSASALESAGRRAALLFDRIVEAIDT
jgi:hypothetical protein